MEGQAKNTRGHHVLIAIIWMISGFLVLIGVVILQFAVHFLAPQPTDLPSSPPFFVTAINILSALGGVVGICLLPVGIVVGIVKLMRSS